MRKLALCICKNKGPDQFWGKHVADQHLCFHYLHVDSTNPSSFLIRILPYFMAVIYGWKPPWQVFS